MCKQEVIDKINNGQAIVISKVRLYIWIATLLIAITIAFTTVKLQAISNTERLCQIENKTAKVQEIQFNLKKLCEHFDIKYTEIKE